MRNKFNILILIALILGACSSNNENKKKTVNNSAFDTQNTTDHEKVNELQVSKFKDKLGIKLTPYLSHDYNIGGSGVKLLRTRLNRAISKVGIGGEGTVPRFIIGPKINLLSQNITSTAPPKFSNTYEITLFIVDVVSESVFSSYSFSFKGIGDSEAKAFINGIKELNFETDEFYSFLLEGEKKMIAFFENNCNNIVSEATTLANMNAFDEAFATINSIPMEASSCYDLVHEKRLEFFKASVNKNCNELLAKMKSELGKFNDPSASGFNPEAMHYYSLIEKDSECFKEAQVIYSDYTSKLNSKAKRDWDFEVKKYKDELSKYENEQNLKVKQSKYAYEYKLKLAELQTEAEIEGNKKLLAKYKYEESPWLVRFFSSSASLIKGELSTD